MSMDGLPEADAVAAEIIDTKDLVDYFRDVVPLLLGGGEASLADTLAEHYQLLTRCGGPCLHTDKGNKDTTTKERQRDKRERDAEGGRETWTETQTQTDRQTDRQTD